MPAAVLDDIDDFVAAPSSKRVRVKGSWTFFYGPDKYVFLDWKEHNVTFDLPIDVVNYLAENGCTYERYSD